MASIAVLCVALAFLHRELAELSWQSVSAQARSIPLEHLLAAVCYVALSYSVMSGYDVAGLRYLRRDVGLRTAAVVSFMAYAIGHNVGLVALSGGSIRYRLYTLAGLSASEIARLIVFVTLTFALGAAGLIGAALLLEPDSLADVLALPRGVLQALGAVSLAFPVAYVGVSLVRRAPLELGTWRIALPGPPLALAQIALSVSELTLAAATLYVLLAPILPIGFLPFLGTYLLAVAAGLLSSLPGGIGVFEAALFAAFPQVPTDALLGRILVYRLLYYVAPLAVALSLLVAHEARQHRHLLLAGSKRIGGLAAAIAPQLLALFVFLAGVVLLLSGASPEIDARLELVSRAIPLSLQELSHLGGSIAGMALMILANGLYRRLRGAYAAALLLLAAGIVASLLKGLDYEEAAVLGIVAAALWFARNEFYRHESIGTLRFSAHWIAAVILVMCLVIWTGLVSYRHVDYANELWWQFETNGDAPRMLRASLAAILTAVSFAFWKALRVGPSVAARAPSGDEREDLARIVAGARSPFANLALLGDKRFLWSADRDAFIMYQQSGRSWIAMGDPVGAESRFEELCWAFRELVDRHDGAPVFYEVSGDLLPLYVDLGLSVMKLGEDAVVSLESFSLEGSRHGDLRRTLNHARKGGAVFEVVPRDAVPAILAELRAVSDSWLAARATAEKGFSLGAYSDAYVAQFDCATVRSDGRITAFANLWQAPAAGELSIDLMRYGDSAPKGVMDYLILELMLWARARGYKYFNLGMAPLAGLERRSLAPLWHRVGHLVFTHGANFYNFEGLRNYKGKFDPDWKPRYLACQSGWFGLPRSLFDASRLISGSVTGLLAKGRTRVPGQSAATP